MDKLEQARVFLDCFKANVNPADPLPVRVPVYNLKADEIKPAIVDWTRTYLDQFECPQCILTPIIRKVLEAVLSHCKEKPCGFTGRDYKTLQLNHEVISRVNQICNELLDNEKLNNLLAELPEGRAEDQPDSSMFATGTKFHFSRGLKHRRRTMEDRHVCLPDFNVLFDTNDTEPTAFYGVYDGHGGQEAAYFAASHLHYYVAESVHYPHDMAQAFRDGFLKTDRLFFEKCGNHHLHSGSTAVACVHHLASKQIDIAWVGDSQAILVKRTPGERVHECLVYPTHVATDPNERERIESVGGSVIHWEGQYRVNGQLAITRAIGDPDHKPSVSAEPGISLHQCTQDDLLLVLASDGLWEGCDEYVVSMFILYAVRKFSDNPQKVTDYLIQYAKQTTRDNITVIIVFLKDPQTIIKETPFIEDLETKARKRNRQNMDINGADNNGFLAENSLIPVEDQKAFVDIQNFMVESMLVKPKSASPLCVGPADDMGFLSDGGLGPETDVDGVHDSKQQSPSPLLEEEDKLHDNGDVGHDFVSNLEQNSMDSYNPFGLSSDVLMEPARNVAEDISHEIDEEASSVSAEPIDLSEEQAAPEAPHVNGTGEHHHFDETAEAGEIIDAVGEQEEMVPALKAELNDDELAPLKSIDEPNVSDLLGGDSIVDNKLIDQLDSFGISEAIRRQLIEQQVSGGTMNHEQEEDEDDGQLMEEKHSEFDGGDDGAEKEDLHHEKAFDSDIVNVSDHHSVDVKQDDDAGCCEDSEEDEWDYVKVNQQQQQELEQEQQKAEAKQQESTPSEPIVEFGNSNTFATEEEELVEKQSEEPELEVEQPHEQEAEQETEQEQPQQEENAEEHYQEQEREGEQLGETAAAAAEPSSSEPPVDILGDNTESTVSESTKEVDDVISAGGDAKEVVNLLNDFKEDVPPPTTTETVCDSNDVNEEDSGAVFVPSDSTNMEASMYGGSVAEQQLSPDSPVSPVDAFQEQQQQQQQQFSQEKDMFGSSMDETMSPTGADELNEKHLYEAEEKTMHHQGAAGDLGWQLNPEAKEFVPVVSPIGEPTNNIFAPSRVIEHESFKLRDDAIVAQSPRKGTAPSMEDLDLPAERDFQTEMDKRPHELEATLDESGEQEPSPLSPNPFDQLNDHDGEETTPANGLELVNGGGGFLQQEEPDLLSHTTKSDLAQFGFSDGASTEEFELLNKVQQLPVEEEEEEQQEPLIAALHSAPVQAAVQEMDGLGADLMDTEPYSAKEELYVEQKETVDESPISPEVVPDFNQLSLNDHSSQAVASNPFAQNTFDEMTFSSYMPSGVYEAPLVSQPLADTIQASADAAETLAETEQKLFPQESPLEALVHDPEPSLLSTQAAYAPAEPEVTSEPVPEPAPVSETSVVPTESPKEQPTVEAADEQPKEAEPLVEEKKASEVSAAAGVVAGATAGVLAAAAVAGTAAAVAASKTAKSKAPAAAGAKKPAPTGTKSSTASSKDGGSAAKSGATAARLGGSTTAAATAPPTAASRKAPIAVAKKAPTTTTAAAKGAHTAATASTNGVKEARPASATAGKTTSLAAKKPAAATDAAKTATTTKTTSAAVPSAGRPKAAPAPSSTTTKTGSASSTTRTAAPKPAGTSTTTAVKTTSSRLSTTGTATRPVTSRPSSAISTTSVPSKPASATTTSSTVKRTVGAAKTNGTTATDGVTKTTKTTTSTTSSATGRPGGVTRAPGTTGATKPSSTSSSTLAAKKTLDAKPAASKPPASSSTTAGGNKPATTARTSLAPRPTATSPAVRKVQQNGVSKTTKTTTPGSFAPKKVIIPTAASKKQAAELLLQQEAAAAASESGATTASTTTTTSNVENNTNGSANGCEEDVALTPPQPADQLLVPVPQAM